MVHKCKILVFKCISKLSRDDSLFNEIGTLYIKQLFMFDLLFEYKQTKHDSNLVHSNKQRTLLFVVKFEIKYGNVLLMLTLTLCFTV